MQLWLSYYLRFQGRQCRKESTRISILAQLVPGSPSPLLDTNCTSVIVEDEGSHFNAFTWRLILLGRVDEGRVRDAPGDSRLSHRVIALD